MVGAYKANFAMMICYAMVCSGVSGVFIYVGIGTGGGVWVSLVVYVCISSLAYSFARDIRRRRIGLLTTNYVLNTNTNPNPTQIYLPGGSSYQPHSGQVNYGYASYPVPQGQYPAQMQVPPPNAYVNPGFASGQAYTPAQLYTTQPQQPNQSYPSQSYGNDQNTLYNYQSPSSTNAQPPPYSTQQNDEGGSNEATAPHDPNNSTWNRGKF